MKRKLKTLAKLLQEYSDAYFTAHGDLIINGDCISYYHFKTFGKETEVAFRDFMYEPIEEKPRVAVYKRSCEIFFEPADRPVPSDWTKLGYLKLED